MSFQSSLPLVQNRQPQIALGSIPWAKGAGGGGAATYTLDPTYQSLMLCVSSKPGGGSWPIQIQVVGVTTGVVYFNQIIALDDWELCPIAPQIDSQVTVTAVAQGGGASVQQTVYVIARTDPMLVSLAGITPGFETSRYQPVIPSSAGPTLAATVTATNVASGTLLAPPSAPPAYPYQWRIWALTLRTGPASAGTGYEAKITNGTAFNANDPEILTSQAIVGETAQVAFPGGLILPVGTGLFVAPTGLAGVNTKGSVWYDAIATT